MVLVVSWTVALTPFPTSAVLVVVVTVCTVLGTSVFVAAVIEVMKLAQAGVIAEDTPSKLMTITKALVQSCLFIDNSR
ncbi:MAG: hypothetical protein V7L20_16190 [Nostoc sp.]|uniref:hypothetical protein n=1 Tax=Nostoc sp. TaxID=1180 RepID=UPI002FF5DC07